MLLKEIIKIEEKLLIINEKFRQKLDFKEAIVLKKYMGNVGEITDLYFDLIKNYRFKSIKDYNRDVENRVVSASLDDLYEYNQKLQNSDVDSTIINMTEIVAFLENISKKYEIDFEKEKETIEN